MYMFWICSSMDEHTYTTYMLGAKKKEKERKRKVMLFLKYEIGRASCRERVSSVV